MRDSLTTSDAETVIRALPIWFTRYGQLHPYRALGYHFPHEFIASKLNEKGCVAHIRFLRATKLGFPLF